MILPEVLEPDLRVVFCGTAAGAESARRGAYYAGPGNAFWATLHDVGFTPRRLQPAEYRELLRYDIGLTDICKVSSGADREIGGADFDIPRLVGSLNAYRPAWIAFNGKNAAKAALGSGVQYGKQAELLGPSAVFVLPSTSGAARGFWDVRYWRELAEAV